MESGFRNRSSSDSRRASGGLATTRPYWEDLRERAVARFEAGETIRSIGKAFGVDPVLRAEMGEAAGADRFGCAGCDRSASRARSRETSPSGCVSVFTPVGSRRGAWRPNWRSAGSRPIGARLDFRSRGRVEFQKKACSPASRIDPTSRANVNAGRRVRPASIQPVSSSSTRLGSRRI